MATKGYTTLAIVKQYMGIEENEIEPTPSDLLLESLILAATDIINWYTNRTFQVENIAEFTEHRFSVYSNNVRGQRLFFDTDLCSIDKVYNTDGIEIPPEYYILYPLNKRPWYYLSLILPFVWAMPKAVSDFIKITGHWVYSTLPPSDIQFACTRLTAYLYRQKDSTTFETVVVPSMGSMVIPNGIPADVAVLLNPYRRRFL